MGKYIVGITGATGSLYADRVIRKLLNMGHEVHLCITSAGQLVARSELDWAWEDGAAPAEIEAALVSLGYRADIRGEALGLSDFARISDQIEL